MATHHPAQLPESDSLRFRMAAAGVAVLLSFAGSGCNNETGPATSSREAIAILNPKPGASVNMEDTLRIVSESDYTRFGGSLTFSVSEDSGKYWILIESLTRVKSGVKVLDTLPWVPKDFGIAPGPVLLMVREYDKVHKATVEVTLTGSLESVSGRPE
jgi:hypothetical protein